MTKDPLSNFYALRFGKTIDVDSMGFSYKNRKSKKKRKTQEDLDVERGFW